MKQPFDLIRAVFWLLAAVIVVEMTTAVLGGLLCWWVNYTGARQVGACMPTAQIIREVFNEILTAVLALLLAGKNMPP